MKSSELRELFEICRENRVASFEQTKAGLKVVFYESDKEGDGEDLTSSLDLDPEEPDPSARSQRSLTKPQPEGPYPASIFPDGEAPTFGDD